MLVHVQSSLTPVELNRGESVTYADDEGARLHLELVTTGARVLYTNRHKIPPGESGNDRGNMYRARLLYEFTADVKVNGQPMTMRRYVGSQESFYEPYVINGVRVWFDGVADIFEEAGGFLNTVRRANGKPDRQARFVLHDMTRRICPGAIHAWFRDGAARDPNFRYADHFIDIGRTFNGDDCFLGAYLGGESHGALDIDMPQDSLMYAPFDLDDQQGLVTDGVKTWPDGSTWRIRTGHVAEQLVPDHTPVAGGTPYGRGARRACWWHTHAHFGLEVLAREGTRYDIDPWILFWQHFEDNLQRAGALKAGMAPLLPARTGEAVAFHQESRVPVAAAAEKVRHVWSFGDGGGSAEPDPVHRFARPGIYPVTVTVEAGASRSSFTQHLTVEGPAHPGPALGLTSPVHLGFHLRPADMLDVYGSAPAALPRTLRFLARRSRPKPAPRRLVVHNAGCGMLGQIACRTEAHATEAHAEGWLRIDALGEGNEQTLEIRVDVGRLDPGIHEATVWVEAPGALNSPQSFGVRVQVASTPPPHPTGTVVDDLDPEFECTPYFWIGHRFHGWGWPELREAEGCGHFYRMNGMRDRAGEFARFNPDLAAGVYEVWLHERTPFASGPPSDHEPACFQVRIVHAEGESRVWMRPERLRGAFPRPYKEQSGWGWLEPQPSRLIGVFRFEEGTDGWVDILAEDSTGQVLVDAIRFLRRDPV